MKVALVVMPWADVAVPSLGAAALKSYLAAQGARVDACYLYVRIADRIGGLASRIGRSGQLYSEWLFGYHLFGPAGSGELAEGLDDMLVLPEFQRFLAETEMTAERARNLVERDIPAFLEECLSDIPWGDYDLVGFSSSLWNHTASLALSREIKKRHPAARIAFGGANVEGAMGVAALKGCPWIDYVVDGEGELALAGIVGNLRRGRPHEAVARVSLRRAGEVIVRDPDRLPVVDINTLPVPDHDDYFRELDRSRLRETTECRITFEASRGCWWGQKHHCVFCGLMGEVLAYRVKDPELALRDILELHRRYRCRDLIACDLILDHGHLGTLIPRLASARRERGLDWRIFFEVKSNLTPRQMDALSEAGVSSLQPGIESFSTPLLRLMRKGVTGIQNVQALKLAAGRGMDVSWNLIWGFPGEDPAEHVRQLETVRALTHLQPPYWDGRVEAHRFSPYHDDWRRYVERKPRPNAAYGHLFPRERFDLDEIAYFFEFDGPDAPKPDAIAALERALDDWRGVWRKNFFAYAGGVGFVELWDGRPLAAGTSFRLRHHVLAGLEERIFRSCETIKSFGEVLSDCPGAAAQEVRAALDAMVARRWLFQEAERFLALAVPSSRLPACQKAALDGLLRRSPAQAAVA